MKAYFCDMYNFRIAGDISPNLNAASCDSPTHSGTSLLVLNDQGGASLNVSSGVAGCLRAQEHGHPPVVCFEPGIMSRECDTGNHVSIDICCTLRAQMGDNQPAVCYQNQDALSFAWANSGSAGLSAGITSPTVKSANSGFPAVCYPINTMVATRGGRDDMRTCFGIGEENDPQFTLQANHEHAVCYANQPANAQIFNESGHGYWLEGFGCLRADGGFNDSNTSHAVCYEGKK